MSTLEVEKDVLHVAAASRPVEYFQSVYELFDRAARAVGGFVEHNYSIAGYTIRLRFAGLALVPSITQALDHLRIDRESEPALTICIWDSFSTGQKMLPPPWGTDDFLARGVIQGYNDERVYTAFQYGSSAVNLLDAERSLGIFWVPAGHDLAYWEKGAPLRTILHWWFSNHHRQLVHAAAVGNGLGGVLIGGKGGSGKSTTALACLGSPLLYAGDDYALVALDPAPTVYSLYNSAKLDGDHLRRFPSLVSKVNNADRLEDEKALLFVHQHYRSSVTTQFEVRAILLPRVTGNHETRLRKTSTAQALASLAPSTIFQLPRAGNETFKFLAAFVRQVPCYNLDLGRDISRIPTVIEELLSGTN
jgi:hypothetical protein